MTLLEMLLFATNVVGVVAIAVLVKELSIAKQRYDKAHASLMKHLPRLNKLKQ